MNLVTSTPMRELKEIQTFLDRFFDDMPLRRIDDEGFSLLDWAPDLDVEEAGNESLTNAKLTEIKKGATDRQTGAQIREGGETKEGVPGRQTFDDRDYLLHADCWARG